MCLQNLILILFCGGTWRRNFPTASQHKAYHQSVKPTCLMSYRYPYGPSTEYLKENICGNDRERLTNACVVGISRGNKRNESVKRDIRVWTTKWEDSSFNGETRISEKVSGKRELYGATWRRRLLNKYIVEHRRVFLWHLTLNTTSVYITIIHRV